MTYLCGIYYQPRTGTDLHKTQNISVDLCNQWEYSVPRTSTDGHGNSEHHLLLAALEKSYKIL